ncbi:MAG: lipid-A-disaccharide synthase N-terminal domain-containing protein [Candidatus Methylacidiphilales bacterium]|nr:lipid-A-disaccharide synthase N-terminal domain-containing protein [Candidatus Methylacidiphilales bacterium]
MEPVLAATIKTVMGLDSTGWFYGDSYWWTIFGLAGNLMFSLRFVVQWWMSEKTGEIVIPPAFWYLSFFGSVVNLIYAFHLDKLPLILGFIFLPFINYRNLRMMWRKQREEREKKEAAEALARGEQPGGRTARNRDNEGNDEPSLAAPAA